MKLTGTNKPITYTTHPPPPGTGTRTTRRNPPGNRAKPPSRTLQPTTPGDTRGRVKIKCYASTMRFPTNNRNHNKIQVHPARSRCNPTDLPAHPTSHQARTRGVRQVARVTAVIAWGKRPVPFRTRKLRPTAPMVLHPRECGRVGHRRTTITGKRPHPTVGPLPR